MSNFEYLYLFKDNNQLVKDGTQGIKDNYASLSIHLSFYGPYKNNKTILYVT